MLTGQRHLVLALLAIAAFLVAVEATADAKHFKYAGGHPITASPDGGFCYIEVPHVHVYAPARPRVLYRVHDESYVFIGDPVRFGYDGPKHAYRGHHPLHFHVDIGVGLEAPDDDLGRCELDGLHYHYFEPAPVATFTVEDGIYVYAGVPTVQVEAPVIAVEPEVHGEVEVHAGVSAGVVLQAPTLEVQVGLPGVFVVGGGHVHGHDHGRHERVKVRGHHRGKHGKHGKQRKGWGHR